MRRFKVQELRGMVVSPAPETESGFATRHDKWLCTNNVHAQRIILDYIARYDPFQRFGPHNIHKIINQCVADELRFQAPHPIYGSFLQAS